MIWRHWAFSGPNPLNGTKKSFNLPPWVWKMAHRKRFYEQKRKKNEKIWKFHFFDPSVKIGPKKGQKGSQITFKGHIPCRYTAIGWFWWFLAKNLRLAEKILHLGWNYSYGIGGEMWGDMWDKHLVIGKCQEQVVTISSSSLWQCGPYSGPVSLLWCEYVADM